MFRKKVLPARQLANTDYLARERAKVYTAMRNGKDLPKNAPLEYVIECLWDEMAGRHGRGVTYPTHD